MAGFPCERKDIKRTHRNEGTKNNCPYCKEKDSGADRATTLPDLDVESTIDRGEAPIFSNIKDRKERTQALLDELNQEIGKLDTKEEWDAFLSFRARSRNYSFNNTILMAIQYGDFTDVRTAKQWEAAGLGGVKKGERAIWLLRPQPYYGDKTDEKGTPVTGPDGKAVKEKKGVYFIGYPAFDVAQINDPDNVVKTQPSLGTYLKQRREEDVGAEGMIGDLTAVAEQNGINIVYEDFDAYNAAGGYAHLVDGKPEVRINTRDKTKGAQAKTLAHELGHVFSGHLEGDNLSEYHSSESRRGDYEAEAESFAYVLGKEYGAEKIGERSFDYLDSWAKGDVDKVKAVGNTVMRSTGKFFKSLEKIKTGETVEEINAKAKEAAKTKRTRKK